MAATGATANARSFVTATPVRRSITTGDRTKASEDVVTQYTVSSDVPATAAGKDKFRLRNQAHIDPAELEHFLCVKCGSIMALRGFRNTPSAHIGINGRCKHGADYTHHKLRPIRSEVYMSLRTLDREERLTRYTFNEGMVDAEARPNSFTAD